MTSERTLSLKARLVGVFGLLLAAALIATGALAFHLTRRHLDRSVDDALIAAARSFEAGPGQQRGPLAARAEGWLSQQALGEESLLAIRVAENRVLASSSRLELADLNDASSLLTSREATMSVVGSADGDVRVITLPLTENGRYVGTLVAATQRSGVNETLAALLGGIGWAAGTALLLALVIGVLLVRRALAPLERMAQSAGEIERTGDLSRRVSAGSPDDEVGRLARAFDRMLERLQGSFNRQQSFLSDAAHEIRTPLTVARGELEWLQASVTSAEEKRVLAVAVEEIDRVDRTVEDMLLLARLDEGATLVTEPVDVELVISEAAVRAMTLAQKQVSVDVADGLRVRADERRLTQVLENLLSNALKYAGHDAAISLQARALGDVVEMDVSDDGLGIAVSELPHVFDRHFRSTAARASDAPGAGLGLAIAKSLVEAMGGTISVRSTLGEGTTFTIALQAVPTTPSTEHSRPTVESPLDR
jgi:two-component system OmpR family sensor kinase